jgi:hypothetical protein
MRVTKLLTKDLDLDPFVTPAEIIDDLRVSRATFHRSLRYLLPFVRLSPRRLGVRRSVYLRWKDAYFGKERAA